LQLLKFTSSQFAYFAFTGVFSVLFGGKKEK